MVVQTRQLSESDRRFLLEFEQDREDAPWMVDSDYHERAVDNFKIPLRWHAEAFHPEWYVGSDLWVYYRLPTGERNHVAPDVFVVVAPNYERESYDIEEEGADPAFVLEVVSPDSRQRDTGEKAELYRLLGVQEYAIFEPMGPLRPQLQGYRLDATGAWTLWPAGPRGELYSAVLELTLVADGTLLRLEDATGVRLLTANDQLARAETAEAREQAERARAEAAEQELARLRAERAQQHDWQE